MTFGDRLRKKRLALDLTQEQLAERLSRESEEKFSRGAIALWEINQTYPSRGKDLILANFFGCDLEWLKYGKGLPEPVSTRIYEPSKLPELDFGSVHDWVERLDSMHEAPASKFALAGEARLNLPTLEGKKTLRKQDAKETRFAIKIRNDSLQNPHGSPCVPEGYHVIADSSVSPVDGDLVVVKRGGDTNSAVYQYITLGDTRYFKSLNPAYPLIKVDSADIILAVVIRSEYSFR